MVTCVLVSVAVTDGSTTQIAATTAVPHDEKRSGARRIHEAIAVESQVKPPPKVTHMLLEEAAALALQLRLDPRRMDLGDQERLQHYQFVLLHDYSIDPFPARIPRP